MHSGLKCSTMLSNQKHTQLCLSALSPWTKSSRTSRHRTATCVMYNFRSTSALLCLAKTMWLSRTSTISLSSTRVAPSATTSNPPTSHGTICSTKTISITPRTTTSTSTQQGTHAPAPTATPAE